MDGQSKGGGDWDYSHEEHQNDDEHEVAAVSAVAAASASAVNGNGNEAQSSSTSTGETRRPAAPPLPIRAPQRNINQNLRNFASAPAPSPSRRCRSSGAKKQAKSQALLRAKASLHCPASFAVNSSPRRSVARPPQPSTRTVPVPAPVPPPAPAPAPVQDHTIREGTASQAQRANDRLLAQRNFGLRPSSLESIQLQPSSPRNNQTTKGEWKEVEVVKNPISFNEQEQEPSSPCARSLHTAAIWNDQMLVFGGYDGESRRNDFYSFHFKTSEWTKIDERGNNASGTPPSPRDRHCAVVHGNGFYVFGGFDGSARVNDLYKYDFIEGQWSQILPDIDNPTLPSPRHSHSAVVHNDKMLVFGGYDGSYRNDLYEFNFITNVWAVVDVIGRIPRQRYRATCVVHDNCLILHGGHDGTRHLDDTHALDLETKRWMSLVSAGTPPINRDSHVSFMFNDAMFIFGGSAGGTAMNDIHELILERSEDGFTSAWRKVLSFGSTSTRFCHSGVCREDNLYVFGGYDGGMRLDDFVRFEFNVDDLSCEIPPSTLVQDMHSFINNEALSDITFIVEDQKIYAHKMMLVRSPYFRAMFSGSMMESQQSTIRIEEIPAQIFLMVLEYLYTDQLEVSVDFALELFSAADLFDIPRLQSMCEKAILESIDIDNAATILLEADLHSAKTLRSKALKYILKHFELVSKSTAFEEMARSNVELVVEILKQR